MRDDERTNKRQTVKIELLSQWKLEAEFRNYKIPPKNFKVEVTDEKERRKMFSKIVNEEMLSSNIRSG